MRSKICTSKIKTGGVTRSQSRTSKIKTEGVTRAQSRTSKIKTREEIVLRGEEEEGVRINRNEPLYSE